MNRTDRLYAIVEELRAVAPRRRSARELAERFEVSVRTIERDIGALQQSGVPIYADIGRKGGYTLDKDMSLPPLNFTPAEAVAVAVALGKTRGTPFDPSGESALRKIVAAMSEREASAARALAKRIRLLEPADSPASGGSRITQVIEHAMTAHRVLRIAYQDAKGSGTERELEPIVVMGGAQGWYLIAWCRLRDAARCFRVDRIRSATMLDAPAPIRAYEEYSPKFPDVVARVPTF